MYDVNGKKTLRKKIIIIIGEILSHNHLHYYVTITVIVIVTTGIGI